ncbi:ubiquitin-conjugating enzyme/RWD-like protein [Cantharellus anzutake]|uniref:ubiquitin-conjugating enzyme/RWD-like protein n=1 Tax=Cantharellus anzutake TaxID=1750568 RepID=UPI001905D864|nr:ubiquitin-conjugating enzyme/RWD-like protein [Cantharellus anzutake]KAF8322811.1 ubiquitin-conjugating enzyme/RWD-like protein [Cantharellus anzutake]
MSLTSGAMRRLMKEITTLRTSPPDGIRIATNDEDILDVIGIVAGPEGTPYEGGYFKIRFQFTEEFPAAPPKCTMITRIFHPNVSKSGEICVNTLKKDWKKEYGIAHILITIKCLLIYPNAESALDEAAGKLLLENYDEYFKHAKLITQRHILPRRAGHHQRSQSQPLFLVRSSLRRTTSHQSSQ